MIVFFSIGERAGMIGLLAALAAGHEASGILAYGDTCKKAAKLLKKPRYESLDEARGSAHGEVLLCVHGRDIIPDEVLARFSLGGINVHPCLGEFPGANPIRRWAQAHRGKYEWDVSLTAHEMTSQVDRGRALITESFSADPGIGEERIYNLLYPMYASVVIRALAKKERERAGTH